jgi:signal transduction histidine kinase
MAKSSKSADPAYFQKAIQEAEKDLRTLKGEIEKIGQLLKQGKLTDKKIKPVIKRALKVMEKHKGVAALLSTPGFNGLPERMQADVIRIESLINELLGLTRDLPRMEKLLKKSPEDDYVILIKATKPYAIRIKQPPRHVGQLVKAVKAGQDIGGVEGFSVSLLPALILLWLIAETIIKGLKSK